MAQPSGPAEIVQGPGVQGFGRDIPLGLALRQVVPARHGYAFGPGAAAKMGARVSWDGKGRPWDVVAGEMVAPLGLALRVQGDAVVIEVR